MFSLTSPFQPTGDQPKAIDFLTNGVLSNHHHQTLLGVTGSGKTFTMANVIQKVNRPALIIAHNKTLAAQLYQEFKSFFPKNAVEYFISYYDYYQPEAYIPKRDAYIEKESMVNEDIERLRHSATRSLFTRKDVIIVASVSCIYGLGMPEDYIDGVISLEVGKEYQQRDLCLQLEDIHYERNDIELKSGVYRISGEVMDIYPSWDKCVYRLEFFGDELERIIAMDPIEYKTLESISSLSIFPATHYVVKNKRDQAIERIKSELEIQLSFFEKAGKTFEAHRLKERTLYDIEMMQEIGYCKGVENYSRHLAGRNAGEPPDVLLDYFPENFIVFIDESHVTLPQIRGMYNGDQSRKSSLVDYGFRLPSAKDNRPLTFDEFMGRIGPCIYVSATPGEFEYKKTSHNHIVEQIIRPTGVLDPIVTIIQKDGQMDSIIYHVYQTIKKNERILITALTKKFAEEVSAFLSKRDIKTQYLHSDIKVLDRMDIINDFRLGVYDVLVGVNLLREGLDIPEVSLVIILDADKEGFLRNERSLIQTIGRAARHIHGRVILYADKLTDSIQKAMEETNRRRVIQDKHNKASNQSPIQITKEHHHRDKKRSEKPQKTSYKSQKKSDLKAEILALEKEMELASDALNFEKAILIRDKIKVLKEQL